MLLFWYGTATRMLVFFIFPVKRNHCEGSRVSLQCRVDGGYESSMASSAHDG